MRAGDGEVVVVEGGGGFSSPVTLCNFHSNYITLPLPRAAAWGKTAERGRARIPAAAAAAAALTSHYAFPSVLKDGGETGTGSGARSPRWYMNEKQGVKRATSVQTDAPGAPATLPGQIKREAGRD